MPKYQSKDWYRTGWFSVPDEATKQAGRSMHVNKARALYQEAVRNTEVRKLKAGEAYHQKMRQLKKEWDDGNTPWAVAIQEKIRQACEGSANPKQSIIYKNEEIDWWHVAVMREAGFQVCAHGHWAEFEWEISWE